MAIKGDQLDLVQPGTKITLVSEINFQEVLHGCEIFAFTEQKFFLDKDCKIARRIRRFHVGACIFVRFFLMTKNKFCVYGFKAVKRRELVLTLLMARRSLPCVKH